MLHNLLRQLDERFPQVSRWTGGRLDMKLPAFAASLGFHAFLLLSLAMMGYGAHAVMHHEFQASTVVDTSALTDLSKMDMQFQDLDQTDKPPSQVSAAGSFSPNLAPVTIATVAPASAKVAPTEGGTASAAATPMVSDVKLATQALLTSTALYGQNVSIKGNGAEYAGGVEGAVDRVANEIVRRLEKGRVLVVWAFDASGSMVIERERLSKHIGTVYTHITQLDEKDLSQDGGLLTAIVSFGHDKKAMTPEPTADKAAIIEAINAVPIDTTGVEATFGTVADIGRKWGKYKDPKGNVYHTMIIVVTDEVGDDDTRLEEAIGVCTQAKVPVYVLGSQSLFGRSDGYMDYTDPKTKQVYPRLPVRQGPESVMIEQIRLPFWYAGYQYDELDSGFGPYALSRLASATGGIYFVTRMGHQRMGFDPVLMREYKPDWVSREQYEAGVLNNEFRKAIIDAALITQQKLPGMPGMTFPPADAPQFKDAMRTNQDLAERTAYTVDEALAPISRVSKLRDRETSRRWQANYDLARGRLLAMKIRCYEYNWACAKMKKDSPKLEGKGTNAWMLVPDTEIHYSDKAAAAGKEAKKLLERVLDQHPGTPWALFAQRELKDPFGFKWVETTVKPIPPNNNDGDDAKKKKMKKEMVKPPELPKL